MECTSTRSKAHCSCSFTSCEKHGNCCQCVVHHRNQGEVPGCFFTPAAERRGERSLSCLLLDRGQGR